MIPVRLTLYNFLSYGDAVEPIDFTGLRVACLSGSNGHGKSALLDAITWALWGHARAHSDDDLIHMGQEEMHVILDFQQDKTVYRVIRKRSKRGRTFYGCAARPAMAAAAAAQTVLRDSCLRSNIRCPSPSFLISCALDRVPDPCLKV